MARLISPTRLHTILSSWELGSIGHKFFIDIESGIPETLTFDPFTIYHNPFNCWYDSYSVEEVML